MIRLPLAFSIIRVLFALLGLVWTPAARGDDQVMNKTTGSNVQLPMVVATDAFVRTAVRGFNGGLPEATADGFSAPKAVRFIGRHDRTYVVYANERTDPMITFFDHRDRRWASPVNVGKSTMPGDAHSNAALAIDHVGRIYIVYGGHHSSHVLRRSAQPENITEWEPERLLSPKATYSNIFVLGDILYWFGRLERGRWGLMACRDGGKSLSRVDVVFEPYVRSNGRFVAYPIVHLETGKAGPILHMFWLIYGSKRWYNIYYAASPDLGKSWRTAGGQPLAVPIGFEQGDLVYKGDTHGWQNQIVVDADGRPGLLFVTGGPEVVSDNAAMFAFWTGADWTISKVCDAASMYNFGCVRAEGKDRFRVFFAGGRWNGGEIAEWRTEDRGRIWRHSRDITCDSPAPNGFPRVVVNAHPEVLIVWCAGDKAPGKIYAWGEAETAGR